MPTLACACLACECEVVVAGWHGLAHPGRERDGQTCPSTRGLPTRSLPSTGTVQRAALVLMPHCQFHSLSG